MEKYWLVLYPDTFLWIKNNEGIIYNSRNFKHCSFHCSNKIKKLYYTLTDLESLYSVEISGLLLKDTEIKEWTEKITGIEAGCLIKQNGVNKKLISYYPVLSIQHGIEQIKWEHDLNIGGKIVQNLNELVFYINGSMYGSDNYYKQTFYPLKTKASIDFSLIESFIKQFSNGMLNRITLIGDLFNYKDIKILEEWILSTDYYIQFVVFAEDIVRDISKLDFLCSDKVHLTVIINNYSTLIKLYDFYQSNSKDITIVFPVKSLKEFNYAVSITEENKIDNYNIIPIYDGKNIKFFEDNVYLSQDDFDNIKLCKRQVFANMTLNVHDFGKFTILPDAKIYSNVNFIPLGSLGDPIYNMIYNEMTERKIWFRIREMEPCCNCIYQWLCPSPGNYELAIGKPNLCHLFE